MSVPATGASSTSASPVILNTITGRAAEQSPDQAVISRSLAYAEGLQPEDYGVLVRLVMRDSAAEAHLRALAAEFRASGWKMGEERLKGVIKRLEAAGYVSHHAEYDVATKRPRWSIKASLTPLPDLPSQRPPLPPQRKSKKTSSGWAYAIRDTKSGHVKIGRSDDPMKRLAVLRTGSSSALELLWMAEGGAALEAFLHARFADRRVRGEWFDFSKLNPSALIQQVAAEFGDGQ